jgi:hypothetical protein
MLKMKRIVLFITIICFALSGFSQKKWGSIDTSTSNENLMNGLWRYQSFPNGLADKDSLRLVPYKLLKSYVAANSGGATSFYDSTLMASTKRLKDSAAAIRAAFPAAVGPGGGSGNIQVNTAGAFAGYSDLIWDPGGRNLLITSPNLDAISVTGYNTGRSSFTVNSQFGSAVGGFFAYNDRASYGAFTLYGIYGSSAAGTIIGKSLADASVLYTAGANNSGLIIGTQTSAPITIGTNDIERLSIDGSGHPKWTLGSDATGDIWYRNSSGYFTRLPIGSTGDVLKVASGLPSWGAGGGSSPLTTNGDLYTRISGVDARLAIGTSAQTLHVVSGLPAWKDTLLVPNVVINGAFVGQSTTQTLATFTTENVGVAYIYNISAFVDIQGVSGGSVTTTVTYTDNFTHSSTTNTFYNMGSTSAALTTVSASNYPVMAISADPNTTITVTSTVSGTVTQYGAHATITRLKY